MIDFFEMKKAVEELTDNRNTVIFDNVGMPSVVVKIFKKNSSDLYTGGANTTHPAFIIGNETRGVVGFSKFMNTIINGRAYSLPLSIPTTNISYDLAVQACRNKDGMWGLVPDALWAVVSYMSYNSGTIPHGNTYYGSWFNSNGISESGLPAANSDNNVTLTLTGSGPDTWSHDGTPYGVYDMCGNAHCWVGGSKLRNGKLTFIPNADSVLVDTDLSLDSSAWKEINSSGLFVEVGSDNTLKFGWDSTNLKWVLKSSLSANEQASSSKACNFADFGTESGLSVPAYLYDVARMPVGNYDYGQCKNSMNNANGEYMPVRGGGFDNKQNAHIFRCDNSDKRSYKYSALGFFSAYYGLDILT